MATVALELATHADDGALRALLAATPMGGAVRLAFEREPSFFHAVAVQGSFAQVVIARDRHSGTVVGVGTRSVRRMYVNGVAEDVGYLGDLRLVPAYRGRTLVARGYRLLRELHADGRARLYVTLIAADNHLALRTIAAGRAGLPAYRDLGLVLCPAVNLGRRRPPLDARVAIARGDLATLPAIVACLDRNGRRRQFAPCHAIEDFSPAGGRLLGLRAEDFYVARRGDRVVGVLARWDQGTFKQTRVVGYGGPLRALRPVLGLVAPLLGLPRFPAPGTHLRALYAACVAVDDDDLGVFRALLGRLYDDAAGLGYAYLLVGLHERDPLAPALAEYPRTPFRARLYGVHFEDGAAAFGALDGRPPHVELGLL